MATVREFRHRHSIPRRETSDHTDDMAALVAAMLHGDWVAAHERLGRNRP